MGRVIHFEIHASTPEQVIPFYEAVLGWRFERWEVPWPYWIVRTGEGEGIDGGLLQRRGDPPKDGQPVNAFVCTAQVEDLDSAVTLATSRGGILAVPRMPVPGVGHLAYVKDPDGNLIGLMQLDAAAA